MQRIEKYFFRVFKADAMLALVSQVLVLVPFDLHGYECSYKKVNTQVPWEDALG